MNSYTLSEFNRAPLSTTNGSRSTDDLTVLPLFTEEALVTYLGGEGATWSSLTDSILQDGDGAFAGLSLSDDSVNPYGDHVQ